LSLRPAQSLGRHPLSQSYRANLPSSLNTINSDTPSPSQRGAPVSVLGTDCIHPFHGLLEFAQLPHNRFAKFSPLRYSNRVYCLDGATTPPSISGSVRIAGAGTGILTCFPFGVLDLRYVLGPTNPRLTNIVEETWPLRRYGFSPYLSFYYCQNFHFYTVHRTLRPCFHPCRTPLYAIILTYGPWYLWQA